MDEKLKRGEQSLDESNTKIPGTSKNMSISLPNFGQNVVTVEGLDFRQAERQAQQ
jgi:hypothetical protein